MNEDELIEKQKQWIEQLVKLNHDNELIGQYTEGRIDDFKKPWRVLDRNDIILTRKILKSEIVFDFDYDTWKKVSQSARKLKKYLDDNEIPYIMAHSGGKGIHIHVFLDLDSLNINEEILSECMERNVEVTRTIRKFIFDDIVKKAKLKVSSPEDRNGLDTTKVYFSSTGKGSLIREFGCVRKTGKVKTVITEIPDEIPEVYEENTVFPGEIVLADITSWSTKIRNELQDIMTQEYNKQKEPDIDITCKGRELPCYKNLLNGVDSGVRNIASFTLGRLGSLVGNSEAETLEDIKIFCKNSNYKLSEAEQSVKSAYRLKDKKKLCSTVCLTFGQEKYCNEKDCPIKIKERE